MKRRYAFAAYLAGAVAARTGDEMSGPALMLAAFAVTGAAGDASAVLAGVTVAAVVGGPLLGAFLDRAARPGRLLGAALATYATGTVLVLAGLGRVPLGVVVGVAVLTGLAGPALSGGWTAQLPAVVPPDRLARANALDASTFGTAALAGPALAGLTAQTVGAAPAVVGAAVLLALAVPAAWRLPVGAAGGAVGLAGSAGPVGPAGSVGPVDPVGPVGPAGSAGPVDPVGSLGSAGPVGPAGSVNPAGLAGPVGPVGPAELAELAEPTGPAMPARVTPRASAPPLPRDLLAGAAVILRNPALARATLTSVLTSVAQGVLTGCVPLLGAHVLGGAGRGALLLSCSAAAGVAANAVLARRPGRLVPDTVVRAAALVQAAALALAASCTPAALVVAALLFGLGEGPQLTALFAVRHREAPERLRGQIFTTGASLKITGFALGAAASGPAAGWSLPGTLLTAAGVAVLAVLAALALVPGGRRPAEVSPPGPAGIRRTPGPGNPDTPDTPDTFDTRPDVPHRT